MKKLTEEELIALVRQVANASACTMDFDTLLKKLESNVPHPNPSELIFNPPGGKVLSAEEVVKIATTWRR